MITQRWKKAVSVYSYTYSTSLNHPSYKDEANGAKFSSTSFKHQLVNWGYELQLLKRLSALHSIITILSTHRNGTVPMYNAYGQPNMRFMRNFCGYLIKV